MDVKLQEATNRWLAQLEAHDDRGALETFSTTIIPLILPGVRARFVTEYPDQRTAGRYPGLISLLGYTPDTTILAARFAAAQALVILHTPETARFISDVRAGCGLPDEAVTAIQFDRNRIEELGDAIGQAIRLLGSTAPIAVEATGGTKPMASYAHIAAALRGLDTIYIDYDHYDPRHRKPLPGSIYLRLLRTPSLRPADEPLLGEIAARLAVAHQELRILAQRHGREGVDSIGTIARLAAEVDDVGRLLARLRGVPPV